MHVCEVHVGGAGLKGGGSWGGTGWGCVIGPPKALVGSARPRKLGNLVGMAGVNALETFGLGFFAFLFFYTSNLTSGQGQMAFLMCTSGVSGGMACQGPMTPSLVKISPPSRAPACKLRETVLVRLASQSISIKERLER